jgi:hypothetical protein
MFYLGLDYAPMENLTLQFMWAMSKADEVINHGDVDISSLQGLPPGSIVIPNTAERWDDDHGMEYDLNCIWKIYDNVTWSTTFAYLEAGDYWKQGIDDKKIDDLFTAFTMLTLSF